MADFNNNKKSSEMRHSTVLLDSIELTQSMTINSSLGGSSLSSSRMLSESARLKRKGQKVVNPADVRRNMCMMQFFEWYTPADQKHWTRLKERIPELAEVGIMALWIPPPTKAQGPNDVGYGIYDIWDLGEFDQKGGVATKYGTKDELKAALEVAKQHKVNIYLDAVLNHKAGADETENFLAKEVDFNDRSREISGAYDIEGWTKFNFPGRGDKYSKMKWSWYHFTGIDFDAKSKKSAIFKICGVDKDFSHKVDTEMGNYDYLMFADIDYHHPDAVNDVCEWGVWVTKELGLSGFRLDAVKHIDSEFMHNFVAEVRDRTGRDDFFAVGEFWKHDLESMSRYLAENEYNITLFDVPLHFNFKDAADKGRDYDLRKIFDNTLVQRHPIHAVTFVDNHDSQPQQALCSFVPAWFKPLAYALILLRIDGYPCVFYGDYYGIQEPMIEGMKDKLDHMLYARKYLAYGPQDNYWDHPNCIGWVRRGDEHHNKGVAVVMSNGEPGFKRMCVGHERKGQVWTDYLGHITDTVTIGDDGFADFHCLGGNVSVWGPKEL